MPKDLAGWLSRSLPYAGFFLLAFVFFALPLMLAGCTVKHEVPAADRALDLVDSVVTEAKKPPPPPKKPVLPPLPDDVLLNVLGDEVGEDTNRGGAIVLHGYRECRDYLQKVP